MAYAKSIRFVGGRSVKRFAGDKRFHRAGAQAAILRGLPKPPRDAEELHESFIFFERDKCTGP